LFFKKEKKGGKWKREKGKYIYIYTFTTHSPKIKYNNNDTIII